MKSTSKGTKAVKQKLENVIATCLLLALIVAAGIFVTPVHKVDAQQGWVGVAQVPGFFGLAVNSTSFSPAVTTGAAGTVTNPASNFLMQIDGGPVFCGGGQDAITESNITLAASTTFLIVYNCPQNTVYAKTGVTGPGSGTGTSGTPGAPTVLLFAIPGVEVPLATVVCNATACGNGGNGSITDSRTAINFPNGSQLSKIAFANLSTTAPDGAMVIVTGTTHPATPGVTCVSGAAVALAVRESGAWACY